MRTKDHGVDCFVFEEEGLLLPFFRGKTTTIGHDTVKLYQMPLITRTPFFAAMLLLAINCGIAPMVVWASGTNEALPYLEALTKVSPGDQANPPAGILGTDGWLFFAPELRHLNRPNEGKNESARALAAIVDFNNQLEKVGILLLVVPVPSKATVYPEKLAPGLQTPTTPPFTSESAFCALLETNGVRTLDLTSIFFTNRYSGAPLYCRTDSHWSPEGIRIAASEIAAKIRGNSEVFCAGKLPMEAAQQQITIRGDLTSPSDGQESITIRSVTSGGQPVPTLKESPVLLLGDSHNLVFHSGGDMHALGAGLPDQLAMELGSPVDLVAVMGSGATAARRSLARRRDNLAGKRVVVWCFSARELTEATSWDKVPVIHP
jgi:alginate O-acetyltransferase complex protein AlgJ